MRSWRGPLGYAVRRVNRPGFAAHRTSCGGTICVELTKRSGDVSTVVVVVVVTGER